MKVFAAGLALFLAANTAFAANFTGSIKVDRGTKDKELVKLAKISLADAVGSALTATPGHATEAEIDNENGFLVYEIKVVDTAGKEHDIVVDAGDSKILHTKAK